MPWPLSSSTVPCGIEIVGVLGVAQQVAADLDGAPGRGRQDAGAVDRQAALDVERAGILNAQTRPDRPAYRPGRCSCPP